MHGFWKSSPLLAASLVATTAAAHHSVFGVFNGEAPFNLTGTVTDVDWVNPHVFLHVNVTDENGNETVWMLETVPAAALRKAGINPDLLKGGGEPVTVTGILAREEPRMGWIHRITYEDGHFYQLSNEQLDRGASQPSVPDQ